MMMMPRIAPEMAARVAVMTFIILAIAATAIQFKRADHKPAEASSASPAVVDADPMRAELIRCQILGEAGAHDAGCLHAWAENRRRGGRLLKESPPVEMFPGARTAPNMTPLDQPTPKDE